MSSAEPKTESGDLASESAGRANLDRLRSVLKEPAFSIGRTNSDYLEVKMALDGRTHIDALKPGTREQLQRDTGIDLKAISDEQLLESLVFDKRGEIDGRYKGLIAAYTLSKAGDPDFIDMKYGDYLVFLTNNNSSFSFMNLADFDYLKDFLAELVIFVRYIVANMGTSTKEDDMKLASEFFTKHKLSTEDLHSFDYAYDTIKGRLTPQ